MVQRPPGARPLSVTALVLQELVGGELLLAEVLHADGSRQGVHYWNRLAGIDIDLTREQFTQNEVVLEPTTVPRPQDVTGARLEHQYRALRAQVFARLYADPAT